MDLLDTHTLIWWVSRSAELPVAVRRRIESSRKKSALLLSAMSLWEIAMLTKKERLKLQYDLQTWIDKVLSIPNLEVVPPDPSILVQAVLLPDSFSRDPVDRIIVATAQKKGAVVITKDSAIRSFSAVQTFWK